MNILVIGSGGREHTLIRKIKESQRVDKLYACPGNGGIAADAICVDIKATDITGVVNFAKENAIDLVVVAPDDPLVLGMVDGLEAAGIKSFGPDKNAAIIEGSKIFSKELMQKYAIPTAKYASFSDSAKAISYIETEGKYPVVIKADGLALGKGVIIAEDLPQAKAAVQSMLEDKAFGVSGSNIVVEEFLTGTEVSVLCFTDSRTILPMVSSMDHKRAYDGDKGLNTGGMGTIAPHPLFTEAVAEEARQKIFIPTIKAMNQEGRPFKGCLYFGLILTDKGPYVIEYNCRFGDPETQVVLPLLQTDIVEIMLAIYHGQLHNIEIRWKKSSCACVILASGGYPASYAKGYEITGLDEQGQYEGSTIYHAGTALDNGKFVTAGGRVLGVTSVANTLEEALQTSYAAIKNISFTGSFCRGDIGRKAMGIDK